MARLTAIYGGIGSGKSVVSRILRIIGYKVYDCDLEARRLMDTDEAIKDRIASEVASEVILADRTIDRRRLAEIVFSDAEKLNCLNSIVHVAVIADIMRWRDANAGRARLWVESAIIYESGIDRIVNDVWEVTAPEELRVERVMKRNGISRREVIDRIRAQARTAVTPHPATLPVINDGIHPLLPQIDTLLHS